LTVTLNPAIDWNIIVDRFGSIAASHRVAGGKGLNVSRVLLRLNVPNRAFAVLGGETGTELDTLARRERLILRPVRVGGPTRVNLTVLSGGRLLKVDQPGPPLSASDLRRIRRALAREIRAASIVVFSGSLPPGMPPLFLCDCIRDAVRLGKRTVLDTSGSALRAAKRIKLWLLKPNLQEWNSIRRSACAQNLLITLGSRGAILWTQGRILKAAGVKTRIRCTVGAGDSLLAGFLHAWLKTGNFLKALEFGVTCGAASVSNPAGRLADLPSIRRMRKRVRLYSRRAA